MDGETPRRPELIRTIFELLDVDGSGRLESQKLERFAVGAFGFEANEAEPWSVVYAELCREYGASRRCGADAAQFARMVYDAEGCSYSLSCSDEELETFLAALRPVTVWHGLERRSRLLLPSASTGAELKRALLCKLQRKSSGRLRLFRREGGLLNECGDSEALDAVREVHVVGLDFAGRGEAADDEGLQEEEVDVVVRQGEAEVRLKLPKSSTVLTAKRALVHKLGHGRVSQLSLARVGARGPCRDSERLGGTCELLVLGIDLAYTDLQDGQVAVDIASEPSTPRQRPGEIFAFSELAAEEEERKRAKERQRKAKREEMKLLALQARRRDDAVEENLQVALPQACQWVDSDVILDSKYAAPTRRASVENDPVILPWPVALASENTPWSRDMPAYPWMPRLELEGLSETSSATASKAELPADVDFHLRYLWRDSSTLAVQAPYCLGKLSAELEATGLLHLRFQKNPQLSISLPAPFGARALCEVREQQQSSEAVLDLAEWEVRLLNVASPSGSLGSTVSAQVSSLAAQLCERSWGIADGFLRGGEADEAHQLLLQRWRSTGEEPRIERERVELSELPKPLLAAHERVQLLLAELGSLVPDAEHRLELEALQLACYSPSREGGPRCRRHYDSTPDCTMHRVCTFILYLNPFWCDSHGGQLRLYPGRAGEAREPVDVEPLHGRLLVFFCLGQNAHEVLPALRPRFAVTWWASPRRS